MRYIIVLVFALMVTKGVSAQNEWIIDKKHTSIRFDIGHMLVSEVEGKFTSFDGTIASEKNDDFSDVQINLSIQLKSVDTGDKKRDAHLQEKDFFHTEKYPDMTFKSTKIEKKSGKEYVLKGNLTLRGITKEITLKLIHNGTIKDPFGSSARAGIKITGEINRTDFGIKYNKSMIGEIITIHCKTELTRK